MTIGVDISPTEIKIGIIEGGVIYQKYVAPFPFNKSEAETLHFITVVISKLMNTNIKGIGITVPSVVDTEKGIVYNTINIPSWKEVHLKEYLEKIFNVPVAVNNDSNCFAFAERYYGECTPYRNIVGVIMDTGLGAGVIINDMLYEGFSNGAGEIGCLSYLDMDYESYCAAPFFKRKNMNISQAITNAQKGDDEALAIWEEFGLHVGSLMKAIMYVYNPQAIILGGEISQAFEYFSPRMYTKLQTFLFDNTVKNTKILVSHKADIGLLGAAALIP